MGPQHSLANAADLLRGMPDEADPSPHRDLGTVKR